LTSREDDGVAVVLGGTGLLGTEIAAGFVDSGIPTRAIGRKPPDRDHAERLERTELRLGDVNDVRFLRSALEGASEVVYAVGSSMPASSNLDPVKDIESSLPTVLRVLDALRAHPGCRFLFLSSGGAVYGNPSELPVREDAPCDPTTSYGVHKLAAEKYVGMYARLYGIDAHIMRISNAYGPLQHPERGQGVVGAFLGAAQRGHSVHIYGDGSIVRDYVHVADVAVAAVGLSRLDHLPLVCNVGSGVGHTTLEVLRIVEEKTATKLSVEWREDRPFDVRAIALDTDRLRELIDWKPRSLEDGIAATWIDMQRILGREMRTLP
jgi:UDP-glucose 4-epimerase